MELLIGACDGGLLPFGGLRVGDLRLENTPWGEGQVLRGSHPNIPLWPSQQLSPEAMSASQAFFNLPAGGREFPGLHSFSSHNTAMLPVLMQEDTSEKKLPPFWESEELGARPPPSCNSHRDCRGCQNSLNHLSPREREAGAWLEAGVQVQEGQVNVRYAYLPCVARLRDNSGQARAVQTSVEKSLQSKGRLEEFNKEMEKALLKGTFSLVQEKDLHARRKSGEPMHYLALFGVEQPKKEGHKIRVVANCRLKNVHCGLLVNDCIEKPPNSLTPLLDVLLWWRTNYFMIMTDLERAYQALRTGQMEKFTRLFFWRRKAGGPLETSGYDTVTFGDLPAAGVLEVAKAKAAELGAHIHPKTAKQIEEKGLC